MKLLIGREWKYGGTRGFLDTARRPVPVASSRTYPNIIFICILNNCSGSLQNGVKKQGMISCVKIKIKQQIKFVSVKKRFVYQIRFILFVQICFKIRTCLYISFFKCSVLVYVNFITKNYSLIQLYVLIQGTFYHNSGIVNLNSGKAVRFTKRGLKKHFVHIPKQILLRINWITAININHFNNFVSFRLIINNLNNRLFLKVFYQPNCLPLFKLKRLNTH